MYIYIYGCFQKIGVPQNRWFISFIRKKPIKLDDLGVPLFLETSICVCIYVYQLQLFGSKVILAATHEQALLFP